MIDAQDVTAVVVTRGDVDLVPVLDPLPFDEIAVWDNSTGEDLGVYGRYAAIGNVTTPVVLVQDDDVTLSPEAVEGLLRAYGPGRIVANMPREYRTRYTDSCLIGFGAIFDRELPAEAFATFRAHAPHTDEQWFRKTSDVVFTALTPFTNVDLPFEYLQHTWASNRMYRDAGHASNRGKMLDLCRSMR